MMAQVISTTLLLAGVVDDLRSRKVHNILVLILAAIGLASNTYFFGVEGLRSAALGGGAAFLLLLPMVLIKALGAGDLKLFVAFGLSSNFEPVLFTALAALAWGALLGLFRSLFAGEFLVVMKNTLGVLARQKITPSASGKVPYTVALLMGWLTYLSFQKYGGWI